MSQYDALFVAGSLVAISLYETALRDTLWLSGDRETQRALLAKLTGVTPPVDVTGP